MLLSRSAFFPANPSSLPISPAELLRRGYFSASIQLPRTGRALSHRRPPVLNSRQAL